SIKKALAEQRLDPQALKLSIERTRKVRSKLRLASKEMLSGARLSLIGSPDHEAFLKTRFAPDSSR
ncbi:MAG: hypothetical protein EBX52_14370, partial [Proteobacteria bacterium]|nr:hypothetical protein [Pseudomonadota bacterium]